MIHACLIYIKLFLLKKIEKFQAGTTLYGITYFTEDYYNFNFNF
jgi:hypothetical protein